MVANKDSQSKNGCTYLDTQLDEKGQFRLLVNTVETPPGGSDGPGSSGCLSNRIPTIVMYM